MNEINLFVPGRLCLFGEHSDWAGYLRVFNADIVAGSAIVTGIDLGIHASAKKSSIFKVNSKIAEKNFECPMQTEELRKIALSDNYYAYMAGVASYIAEHYSISGVEITINDMDLPIKSGLSSSAAICVLVARAFNILYELNLNTQGEMMLAFKGEQRTKSRCGRLDQACAFGSVPVIMSFDGEDITVKQITVKSPLRWVFASLNGNKDTITILADLNKSFPFARTRLDYELHSALGVENQNIVSKAVDCIQNGKKEELGLLMTEAQRIFDEKIRPASPIELEAPKLHGLLNDARVKELTFGGKGVGSGGDGSVQFLAKNNECSEKLREYLTKLGFSSYAFTINS